MPDGADKAAQAFKRKIRFYNKLFGCWPARNRCPGQPENPWQSLMSVFRLPRFRQIREKICLWLPVLILVCFRIL